MQLIVFSASSLLAKHTAHHLMSLVPYQPVGEPWWQVEAWWRGQKHWMNQGMSFHLKTEELYVKCRSMRDACRELGDFNFVYTGNTRTGPITYVLDFEHMTQTNRMTNEVLRIRRVSTVVLDGHQQ